MTNAIAGEGNVELRIIKTETQYRAALAEIERLVDLDPDRGTHEADRLELLATLVQAYESARFPFEEPDPVDAIQFRMQEKGLKPRDLIPYIGSRSKVSEVLSSKRPLSLQMIRALSAGLGIPAEILLHEPKKNRPRSLNISWDQFPVVEMARRGWIPVSTRKAKKDAPALLNSFFAPLGPIDPDAVFWRRTIHARSAREMDQYALLAWIARILIRAKQEKITVAYEPGIVDSKFMRQVALFSTSDQGPLLAKQFLAKHGIVLIIEEHLPRTRLDGAAMLYERKSPVIGLTLRYDRLDNFWFTLMHELAHIALHVHSVEDTFIDDLDAGSADDKAEGEADRLAGEALIPRAIWRPSRARRQKTPSAVREFAMKLEIHPAIVAGRIRHETKDFRILNQLVGHGVVRRLFHHA